MTQHTPTPLNADWPEGNKPGRRLLVKGLGNKQIPIGKIDDEYSDYVVRAVNNFEELLKAAKGVARFHDPSGSAGYYARCNGCGQGNAEISRINHETWCSIMALNNAIAKAEGK